jgi:hypothetical protein
VEDILKDGWDEAGVHRYLVKFVNYEKMECIRATNLHTPRLLRDDERRKKARRKRRRR